MRRNTLRYRVQQAVETAGRPLSSKEVVSITGLTYSQVVDALNALHNHERVTRVGRKFTAMWCARRAQHRTTNEAATLAAVMFDVVRAGK